MQKKLIDLFHILIIKKTDNGLLQFLRYFIAGGIASVVDLTVFSVLYKFFGINYLIAAPIGFSLGIITNYTINTLIVFESSGNKKTEFVFFASIGIISLLWTELILWILVDHLNTNAFFAKIVAMTFVLFWNFFMRKKFVFKKAQPTTL